MIIFLNTLLAVHANAWLDGDREAVGSDFLERHPSFQYFRDLDFEGGRSFPDWLEAQRDRGVDRVWLHRPAGASDAEEVPPHQAAAFAGGTRVGLLTTGAVPGELWVSREQLVERPDPAAPDRKVRPWRLGFTRHDMPDAVPLSYTVDQAIGTLSIALGRIESFAAEQELGHWARHFASAAARLDGRDGTALGRLRDQFPAGSLDLSALGLLAAAERAWVFGGMGSWNDVWVEGREAQERYGAVSAELFDAIGTAYVAVANDGQALNRGEFVGPGTPV